MKRALILMPVFLCVCFGFFHRNACVKFFNGTFFKKTLSHSRVLKGFTDVRQSTNVGVNYGIQVTTLHIIFFLLYLLQMMKLSPERPRFPYIVSGGVSTHSHINFKQKFSLRMRGQKASANGKLPSACK